MFAVPLYVYDVRRCAHHHLSSDSSVKNSLTASSFSLSGRFITDVHITRSRNPYMTTVIIIIIIIIIIVIIIINIIIIKNIIIIII